MKKMKNKKLWNKFLAVMMSFAFVATLLPASAFTANVKADDYVDTVSKDGMTLKKTAKLENDGTYTINLEAYATGETTKVTQKSGTPLDIVLVLDQSGSMANNLKDLKDAANEFVKSITDNANEYNVDHRIAVVGFAGAKYGNNSDNEYYYANTELFIGSKQYNYIQNGKESNESDVASTQYKNAFQTVTDSTGAANLTASINELAAKGGTHMELGMEMANDIFNANDNTYTKADGTTGTRNRIVVMFTDGEPGDSGFDNNVANASIKEAYTTKNTYGATVYTVGLYSSSASDNVTNFMNYLSSNYPTVQSMSTNNNDYVYTPVYSSDLDTSKTYYVIRNDSYTAVTYKNNAWRRNNNNNNSYTPTTSANDNTSGRTQFYTRTDTRKTADKYYMTTSNSSELNNIFTNISQDIQNPSTTVTLNAESVMRDVIGDGFKLPDGYDVSKNVTIKTVAGSRASEDAGITWGTETTDPAGITASVDGQNVNITGFNYSNEYIAPSHDGKKLVITIKGVEATDAAIQNNQVDTNAETSGIYATSNAESCIPFPQPKTILTSKSYVLDYAKEVDLNSSDWKQSTLTKISGDMAGDAAAASTSYGKVTKDGNTVKYQPTTTNWNGYDSFYAFGTTTDSTVKAASANTNGNLWSKVNVIPANNVYYEDDFITNESTGTVGIKYDGTWTTDGKSAEHKETANGDVHGWEASLVGDTGYSDGSAHKLKAGATATFTFTGKGVDIYSRTDMTTGTVTANLYEGTEAKKTKIKKALIVDNKSVSGGQYYQIPTLSFEDLDYGTYTVKITVTNQAADRTTYYLDGIRVYNPVQEDATVSAAYGTDEINAVFDKARDLLESGKAAFIDEGNDENGNSTGTSTVGDYTKSGIGKIAPKNEIYLAKGQSIVLKVNSDGNNTYYLGLKAPQGVTTAEFTNGSNKSTQTIKHTADLYYKVTPNSEGKIVVTNSGEKILSITKLRTAGSGISGASLLSDNEALTAFTEFKAANSVSYQSKPETDEALAEQETPVVTETEKNETIETGNVVIKDSEESKKTTVSFGNNSIKSLFNSIKSFFGNR